MKQIMLTVPAAGTAGSAAGTSTFIGSAVGFIRAVYVMYTGQGSATPTVTIKEARDGTDVTLMTLATQNTARTIIPVADAQGADDGADVSGEYVDGIPLFGGYIKASISGADAHAQAAKIRLIIEE